MQVAMGILFALILLLAGIYLPSIIVGLPALGIRKLYRHFKNK